MIASILAFFQSNGFVLELLCCNVLFTYSQEKRRGYWLRILLTALVLLTSSVLLNSVPINSVFFNFLKYFIWFFLTVFSGILSCQISFSVALFLSISAYVCQHMAFKVGETVLHFLPQSLDDPVTSVIYLTILVCIYALEFLVYARRIKTMDEKFLSQNQFIFLCVGVAIYTSILQFIFAEHMEQIPNTLRFTYSSLDIVCCLFALSMQYGLFRTNRLEEEKRLMEHILHMQEEKFRESKENIELINIKCHDLKKHLLSLHGLDQEELKRLYSTLNIYDMSVKSGNEILDIILAEKSLLCQQAHIQLECMASGGSLSFISTADVYSLFGNAIDNAIESVLKVSDLNKRYISISIKQTRGLIVFHIENPYVSVLQFADGLPVTTKDDKSFHGFGLKSIQLMAEKYHGYLSITAKDNLFSLNIAIPVPAQQADDERAAAADI